jgi:hypothetical protein
MEILIHSVLHGAQTTSSVLPPFHIRYWEAKGGEGARWENRRVSEVIREQPEGGTNPSLVIIREPYSYLEVVIRAMFQGVEDVQILMDRRRDDWPQSVPPGGANRRTPPADRRVSVPLLDIVIKVDD